jgi:hypothetical protein
VVGIHGERMLVILTEKSVILGHQPSSTIFMVIMFSSSQVVFSGLQS